MPQRSMPDLARPLRFWSEFLGTTVNQLLTPGVTVRPHAGLGDYHGAWIFEYQGARVLSLPAALVDELQSLAVQLLSADTPVSAVLVPLFGERLERTVGPAYHGFLTAQSFLPHPAPEVRALTAADQGALERLREAAGETAWSHAGIDLAQQAPCFGVWLDGCLISAAQNEVLGPGVVSPGVVTHPYFRGRGGGKAAVTAVAAHALERDELVLYQTLLSNGPALAVAAALGFQECGIHTAVRFR